MDGGPFGHDGLVSASGKRADTLHVGFALLTGVSMLTVAAAIEPLKQSNEILLREEVRWTLTSSDGRPVITSNGASLSVHGDFSAIAKCDVILVCTGERVMRHMPNDLSTFMRRLWKHGKTVGALGTGAFVLAEAGLLRTGRFVLPVESTVPFQEHWPELEPKTALYCEDGRVVTCAGGAAPADMMLNLVALKCGRSVARLAGIRCLSGRWRKGDDPQDTHANAAMPTRHPGIVRSLKWIEENYPEPFDVDACAASAGVSRRQLERLYSQHFGRSPVRYVNDLRLDRARNLLLETQLSVTEISTSVGFGAVALFSKLFRRCFCERPSETGRWPLK